MGSPPAMETAMYPEAAGAVALGDGGVSVGGKALPGRERDGAPTSAGVLTDTTETDGTDVINRESTGTGSGELGESGRGGSGSGEGSNENNVGQGNAEGGGGGGAPALLLPRGLDLAFQIGEEPMSRAWRKGVGSNGNDGGGGGATKKVKGGARPNKGGEGGSDGSDVGGAGNNLASRTEGNGEGSGNGEGGGSGNENERRPGDGAHGRTAGPRTMVGNNNQGSGGSYAERGPEHAMHSGYGGHQHQMAGIEQQAAAFQQFQQFQQLHLLHQLQQAQAHQMQQWRQQMHASMNSGPHSNAPSPVRPSPSYADAHTPWGSPHPYNAGASQARAPGQAQGGAPGRPPQGIPQGMGVREDGQGPDAAKLPGNPGQGGRGAQMAYAAHPQDMSAAQMMYGGHQYPHVGAVGVSRGGSGAGSSTAMHQPHHQMASEGGGHHHLGSGVPRGVVPAPMYSMAPMTKPLKRPRLVWTKQLHKIFVDAVKTLDIDKAAPKQIMNLMDVEGLTRENVASHLQKYRLSLKTGGGGSVVGGDADGRTRTGSTGSNSNRGEEKRKRLDSSAHKHGDDGDVAHDGSKSEHEDEVEGAREMDDDDDEESVPAVEPEEGGECE